MEIQKEQTAQEIIKEVEKEDKNKIDCIKMFYPDLYKLRLADKNLTKCLKGLKDE